MERARESPRGAKKPEPYRPDDKLLRSSDSTTCGTAARLPNKPGSQKLTPPSSAVAIFGTSPRTAQTRATTWTLRRRVTNGVSMNCPSQYLARLASACIFLIIQRENCLNLRYRISVHPPSFAILSKCWKNVSLRSQGFPRPFGLSSPNPGLTPMHQTSETPTIFPIMGSRAGSATTRL